MGNANTAGPMPIARLTNDEYSNTIRDLLADPSQPGRALPPDSEGASGYSTAPKMDVRLIRAYQQAAETLAPVAVAKLGMLFSCDAGSTRDKEDACADRT